MVSRTILFLERDFFLCWVKQTWRTDECSQIIVTFHYFQWSLYSNGTIFSSTFVANKDLSFRSINFQQIESRVLRESIYYVFIMPSKNSVNKTKSSAKSKSWIVLAISLGLYLYFTLYYLICFHHDVLLYELFRRELKLTKWVCVWNCPLWGLEAPTWE